MSFVVFNRPYKWYAVYTKSRAEKKVYAELVRKGIETYLPLIKVKRQWSDRMKIIEEPLLRGYVFVKVSRREYYDVLVTSGALYYICFDGKPTAIPDCQILNLKVFIDCSDSGIEVTSERIHKGDFIWVVCGPLKNLYGEVVEIRGKRRILLRLSSLGYCVHAEVGLNKIELIEKTDKRIRSIAG